MVDLINVHGPEEADQDTATHGPVRVIRFYNEPRTRDLRTRSSLGDLPGEEIPFVGILLF